MTFMEDFSALVNMDSSPMVLNNVIRIGPDFQVEIPEVQENYAQNNVNETYRPIWIPNPDKIDDTELDQYLNEAQENGCNELRALTILFQFDYDAREAIAEIRTQNTT